MMLRQALKHVSCVVYVQSLSLLILLNVHVCYRLHPNVTKFKVPPGNMS